MHIVRNMSNYAHFIKELTQTTPLAGRDAFGRALVKLGEINQDLVVIDGDLASSTRTSLFAEEFPERFFNIGISEQDMIGIAVGLASCGKVPITVTYAAFLVGRGLDQIRNLVAYTNSNVKLIGAHAGIVTGPDGATHQALEDIAIMRSIPRFLVLSPSDAVEVALSLKFAVNYKGPLYLRIARYPIPVFHTCNYKFEPGKIEIIFDFKEKPVTLMATGIMVTQGIEVIKQLQAHGISAGLCNVHTLKPVDKSLIKEVARHARVIVTLEDHNVIGGLGSVVSDVLSETPTSTVLLKIGMNDEFGMSGTAFDLLKYYHLTPEDITKRILQFLEEWKLVKNNAI